MWLLWLLCRLLWSGFCIGAKANEKDSSAHEARAKNLVYIYPRGYALLPPAPKG